MLKLKLLHLFKMTMRRFVFLPQKFETQLEKASVTRMHLQKNSNVMKLSQKYFQKTIKLSPIKKQVEHTSTVSEP